jgi:hypothetical protein
LMTPLSFAQALMPLIFPLEILVFDMKEIFYFL